MLCCIGSACFSDLQAQSNSCFPRKSSLGTGLEGKAGTELQSSSTNHPQYDQRAVISATDTAGTKRRECRLAMELARVSWRASYRPAMMWDSAVREMEYPDITKKMQTCGRPEIASRRMGSWRMWSEGER
jgi:hypothetical protein